MRYIIVAHAWWDDDERAWDFDSARSADDAAAQVRKWNDRAAREWPRLWFTLRIEEIEQEVSVDGTSSSG